MGNWCSHYAEQEDYENDTNAGNAGNARNAGNAGVKLIVIKCEELSNILNSLENIKVDIILLNSRIDKLKKE